MPARTATPKLNARTERSSASLPTRATAAGAAATSAPLTILRQQQSGDTACQREEHALDQQLPHQSPPRAAERRAHGKLRFACRAAREKEAGDVDARDDQQQADGAKEDPQHRPGAANRVRLQRDDVRGPEARPRRAIRLHPRRDRCQLGFRLFHVAPGFNRPIALR